jgi:hypothetical protein
MNVKMKQPKRRFIYLGYSRALSQIELSNRSVSISELSNAYLDKYSELMRKVKHLKSH